MQLLYSHCCGLDVHKKNVVACRLTPGPDGATASETRTFLTTTAGILALADWLRDGEVTHVAMESTGVYWKPLFNLLEEEFTLLLVNAAHIKHVPGRKSDVKDAAWIAQLLQHGLLRASFVPERAQRELRELTRYRTSLIRERSAEVNRLQKTLEGANVKLASVVSDVTGRSAQQMLRALVAGQTEASELAEMARGRMRDKIPQLTQALTGCFGEHQRFMVGQQLAHIDDLEKSVQAVNQEIERRLSQEPTPPKENGASPASPGEEKEGGGDEGKPKRSASEAAIQRLMTIPGVGRRTAQILLAEVGLSVERFPSAGHLSSWAGLTPGQNESAGKQKSSRTRKGNKALRASLMEAAQAAGRSKENALSAQYGRLVKRVGKKKGSIAIGRRILEIAFWVLRDGCRYEDRDMTAMAQRDQERSQRRAVHQLEQLGYHVTLEAKAAA